MSNSEGTVEQIMQLSERVTRSTIAIVDTVAARGGFRGEELSTIGQLRDQCLALVQMIENERGNNLEGVTEEDD